MVQQLRLKYVDEVSVSGYDEVTKKAFVYSVKIIFNNLEEFVIRAIASGNDLVLVGRDKPNKWSLFLKGPSKTFEIS